jgi:hypothetical protein
MSLFEHPEYQWQETLFVYFHREHRPAAVQVEAALKSLGSNYRLIDIRADDEQKIEAATLENESDSSAMEICFTDDAGVTEQLEELLDTVKSVDPGNSGEERLNRLASTNVRFDVLHFERLTFTDADGETGFDPGGLIVVMEKLAEITQGVAIDPGAGTVL